MADVDNLVGTLRDVVVELQRIYPQHSIEFLPEDIGTQRCSSDRISQLFDNLRNNAFTHGASDQPVHTSIRRQEGTLVIAVINHGTPIPPEVLPHLFQPHWRGSKKNPHAGLGLGLYIASEIAHSHRGDLHVHSNEEADLYFQDASARRGIRGRECHRSRGKTRLTAF
ncbi:sensor histidine kinase [Herbaspirillum sp. GCM10030257]|uniref:sensor histidine kinase n=1 Tax=Herbaspirillum sp. GCM10030257 TaxID=3273393 RepID=UPI0036203372